MVRRVNGNCQAVPAVLKPAPFHGKCRKEQGGAALEVAVVFPFFVVLVVAVMVVAWTSWVQAAAAVAGMEAARSAAYHQGGGINPGSGSGRFYQAVSGIAGARSAGWLGAPEIMVHRDSRAVSVQLERRGSFSAGTISASRSFRTGTFTRIQEFFGGAPRDTWE